MTIFIFSLVSLATFGEDRKKIHSLLVIRKNLPYTMITSSNVVKGITIDVMSAILKKASLNYNFVFKENKTFKYLITSIQNDTVSGGGETLGKGRGLQKGKPSNIYWLGPLYTDKYVFCYNNSKMKLNDVENYEDLKKYKIGLSRRTSYGLKFNAVIPKLNVTYVPSFFQNIIKLSKGEIDIAICPVVGTKYIFKKYAYLKKKISFTNKPIKVLEFYFPLSVKSFKSPETLKGLTKILKNMHLDKSIQQILNLYK